MDLQEWVKKGNVWKLESEAFKKPIEIKIWYDNKELAEFKEMVGKVQSGVLINEAEIGGLKKAIWWADNCIRLINERIGDEHDQLEEFKEKWNEEVREKKEMYKLIADLKTTVETLSGTILHLQEQTSLIQKKITKQPMVFHDKWFISWRESSGLWMINIPDGDYLLIAKYVIWEHNEYVTNQDELLMDKIHVEGQSYVPFYKLEWGTELDTPTATIYYDLVFMPI